MHKSQDLDDETLLRRIAELAAQSHLTTAELLVHLAEAEARHLHLRRGYDSMKTYCVEVLHFSEDAARRRVHAARVARSHPALVDAIADGRLHLTAIHLLAAHLSHSNVDELIAAATHKTKTEIELELARRYPRAEALRLDDGVSQVVVPQQPFEGGRALARTDRLPEQPSAIVAPITAKRYRLDTSIDEETEDDLRAVQRLLGHSVPGCDVPEALKRSLKHMRLHLEEQKFAQVEHPREPTPATNARTIPANVRRAVFERDRGKCAFVGDDGHRCGSKHLLEFDHIVPVALGGESTVDNVRLVCRAHNQYEADRKFGRTFMDEKRSKGMDDATKQVASGLRNLGMSVSEARQCAEATNPAGSVVDRLREALKMVKVRGTTRSALAMKPMAETEELVSVN